MNVYGRIPLCGAISSYNEEGPPPGPSNFQAVIPRRLTIRGFIVLDHYDLLQQFSADAPDVGAQGKISYRETIVDGIENMPGLPRPARRSEHGKDARAAGPGVGRHHLSRRGRRTP